MPVPEIQVPTAHAESTPVASTPTAPLGAYAGVGVGAALNKLGEGLHEIGVEEQRRAMEAKAQEAETSFQKQALKIRDEYRTKFNWDAVSAHTSYAEALEKARDETEKTLPSKYARSVYNNNSLRNLRFVQESMDAHFEQQNKSYQIVTFNNGIEQDVVDVTKSATEKYYNAPAIESKVYGARDKAYAFGISHGMDEKTATDFAANKTHKVTDGLFGALFRNKSQDPALLRSELDKYSEKGLVSARTLEDSQKSIGSHEAAAWVGSEMTNMIRIDHRGNTDPQGYIPYKQVTAAIKKIPDTDSGEMRQQKIDLINKEWKRSMDAYELAGREMEGDVVARRVVGNQGDLLWQKFDRLYPLKAQEMESKADNRAWTQSRRGRTTLKESAQDAFGAVRFYLDGLTQDEARQMSDATVDSMMRQNYKGSAESLDQTEMAKAREFLKKLKDGKADALERKFNQIANQVLEQEYKGNKTKTQSNMNRAHYILDDLHRTDPKLTEEDLRLKLTEKFKREHWYSGRPGESYEPPPRAKTVKPTSQKEYDALPPGTEYEDTDGTIKRKR